MKCKTVSQWKRGSGLEAIRERGSGQPRLLGWGVARASVAPERPVVGDGELLWGVVGATEDP